MHPSNSAHAGQASSLGIYVDAAGRSGGDNPARSHLRAVEAVEHRSGGIDDRTCRRLYIPIRRCHPMAARPATYVLDGLRGETSIATPLRVIPARRRARSHPTGCQGSFECVVVNLAAFEKSLLPEARIDVPAGARTETLKSAPPSILFVQTAARPSIESCGLLARLTNRLWARSAANGLAS